MASRRARPSSSTVALVIAGIIAFAVGAALLLADLGRHDFIAFYAAARLVAHGQGSAILDPTAILAAEHLAEPGRTALLPWIHPPVIALVLAPLGLLPFAVAAVAMTALDVVCLVWSLRRMAAMVAATMRVRLFAAALVAPPALVSLIHGQTTPADLALIVAAMTSAGAFTRGLALGLTMIRPQTGILFALAGMSSRRSAAGVATGWVLIGLASVALVGPAGLQMYAQQLIDATAWSASGDYGMNLAVSWASVAIWVGHPALGPVVEVASLGVGAIAVASARGPARIVAASAWCLIGTPHAGVGDALVVYPLIAALASRSGSGLIALIASGYVVMMLQLAGVPLAPFWILGLGLLERWRRRAAIPPSIASASQSRRQPSPNAR